jgi:CDP-glycerol glycerophosphotransferase
VIDVCLNLLLSILSFGVPKRKDSVVFGSMVFGDIRWNYGFNGSSKSLFLFLLANGHRELVTWVTDNPRDYLLLRNKGYPVTYKYSPRCLWKVLRGEFLVTNNGPEQLTYVDIPGRFKIVQVWHGTPLKKIMADDKINHPRTSSQGLATNVLNTAFDKFQYFHGVRLRPYFLTVASSKEDQKVFQRVFRSRRVEILGSPRNDIFFNSSLASEDYDRELRLGMFSKVLLYAPTFRDGQEVMEPFSNDFALVLGDYLVKNNYLLLVKEHPTFRSRMRLKAADNVVDVSDLVSDIQEILIRVDVLITDYSSVAFDFALTDKPMIFYPYDYENYIKNCRDLYFDYFHDLPGPFARKDSDLLELIKTVADWSLAKDYVERYRSFKKRFNEFDDGLSSQRVLRRLGILS